MPKKSAGILVYRTVDECLEVLLVHPGGPYWSKKDDGVWSIPKGEIEENEDPFKVALREFTEETGAVINGNFTPLELLRQPGGKLIFAWAVQNDLDITALQSNTFSMEWPPRSGRQARFPEIDRAGWFSMSIAQVKILKGQLGFIVQLRKILAGG